MSRALLICGATGKQGGAVIDQLLREKADFEILAVTRDATSGSAQRLLNKSAQIKLVQGNLADPTALFKTAKSVTENPIWGVFSVQSPMGFNQGGGGELGQGKALVDASLAAGVEFFVYTSVDRNGESSLDNPTDIPHFIHKHQIEKHLIAKSKGSNMEWTILRPVAFMDNFTDNFFGRVFVTSWKMAVKEKPLQLVATSDIGFFGAQAFMNPEKYKGQGVSLAGDELTFDQMVGVFQKTVGRAPEGTYRILCWLFMALVKDFGVMFKWFYDVGYGADIAELKKKHAGLKDFETWLRTESEFKKYIK
ncbi:nucleoside-diphosphate-sugar epimerase family protein [Colletotrichum truncatum]|uniref:Nucleoside-diphosphate-sugar epimerase family protein n=1 Tax=Colletotrichum truncatum TaxID=5467 RepID=A0ACC3YJ60_COLTU|nr:nucleoside-diphosphate-sugar epimerase family protein [Colletotrichum truncatum]KAF6792769.1 nucleoside-diphosphate-sugar epimerase family protein [Colletotrichum truncatum]